MAFFRHKSFVWILFILLAIGMGAGFAHAQEDIYSCPMHPQVVSDKPGDCPICHMRLVLRDSGQSKPEEQTAIEGRIPIKITPTAADFAGIRTETVGKTRLKQTLRGWGMVAHDPKLYELQIEFLRQERLNYERVRERTPVAQKRGLTDREKIGIQFLEMGLTPEWVKLLEEKGVPDKRLIYHHEVSGAWIYIQLREKDAALVKPGDLVSLLVPAFPDLKVEGRVEFVDSLVDEETMTVRVRAVIENVPAALKPNTSVSVSIPIDLGESVVVSEGAALFAGNRTLVFVEDKGVFTPREVVLGSRAEGHYQVKSGLEPGEKVASAGNFFIDSESRLQASFASVTHGGHS